MKFTGKLKEPIIDFATRRLTILFEPQEDFTQAYEELKDCEKLKVHVHLRSQRLQHYGTSQI